MYIYIYTLTLHFQRDSYLSSRPGWFNGLFSLKEIIFGCRQANVKMLFIVSILCGFIRKHKAGYTNLLWF